MTLRKATTLLVAHVTATPPNRDIGAKEVDAMHRALGWSSIGYHGVIRRDGTFEPGRGLDEVGAHVAGYNSTSLGFSLVGGVDANGKAQDNATPAQMATLEAKFREMAQRYPGAGVCGHRDLSPDKNHNGIIEPGEHIKECPCFDAIPWAQRVGLPAANIKGNWESFTVPAGDGQGATQVSGPDGRLVYLQKLLARTGLQFGAIDGIVGPRTATAIKLYQDWNDLPQTGEFDAATVAHLRNVFETKQAA